MVANSVAAPAVVGGVTLTFSLTATDSSGSVSAPDAVTVVVLPPTVWRASGGAWVPLRVVRL